MRGADWDDIDTQWELERERNKKDIYKPNGKGNFEDHEKDE